MPTATPTQTNAQQNATVVGLTNGNYLVVWEGHSGKFDYWLEPPAIVGQIYNAFGAKVGGDGNDTLTGGTGIDTMKGGLGNNTGGDTINAFETSLDRFDLAGGSFSSAVKSGKDTILTPSVSMPVPPVSVSLLSVGQWNALVLPAGGSTSDHHPVALAIDAAYSGRLRPAPSGGHAGFLFV